MQQQMVMQRELDQSEVLASATILPFPVKRRERWAKKQRDRAACFPKRHDEWLLGLVDKHREMLIQIGVDPAVAEAQARDMHDMLFPAEQEKQRA